MPKTEKKIKAEGSGDPKKTSGGNSRASSKKKRSRRRKEARSEAESSRKPKTVGMTEELEGYVFDCTTKRQTDQYVETMEALATYVGKTFVNGMDIKKAVTTLQKPDLGVIADLGGVPTEYEKQAWQEKVKDHVKRIRILDQNIGKLYNVVWGQCTRAMQDEMKTWDDWDVVETTQNAIQALLIIKAIVYNFESQQKKGVALTRAYVSYYGQFQKRNQSVSEYYEQFLNKAKTIKESGGQLGHDPHLIAEQANLKGYDPAALTKAQMKECKDLAEDAYLAINFIEFASREKFGTMVEDLENEYTDGDDLYPETLTGAYNKLLRFKRDSKL